MKRVCAALAVALSPTLGAHTLPIPARASLCEAADCTGFALEAGADLRSVLAKHIRSGHSYRLTLELPAGEFALERTWLIEGEDLPRGIEHLTIAGAPAVTRLTGARSLASLDAATRSGDGRTFIQLPERMTTGGEDVSAVPVLLDSRGEMRLARWPREGWNAFSRAGAAANDPWIPLDARAPLGEWRGEPGASVQGFFFNGWHLDDLPLADVRVLPRLLRLSGTPRYGIGTTGRLRVLNLCSAVREPGDYCVDVSKGTLVAIPRGSSAGMRLTTLTTPLLHLRDVSHATVRTLSFADTRGDAVLIERSRDVELSQLTVARAGRSGIIVDAGRDVRVTDSAIEDTGSHAIVLRGGIRATLTPSGHRFDSSRIVRPSRRLATPATGIRLEGVGHVVRGNVIEDAPHSAIWFDGNDHRIESNWIERVCLEVDDAGAIYAGRDWTYRGNAIRGNVIAALPRRGGMANLNAVYLDDMLSGTTVENNLFYDVPRGVLVGGGRDNRVEGNLFVRTGTSIHVDQRALEWASASTRAGGVMRERLIRVPYRNARWRRAYPALADILDEQPARPLHNVARANAALDAGAAIAAPAASGIETPLQLSPAIAADGSAQEFLLRCARETACAARVAHMNLPAPPESTFARRRETSR